MALTQRRKNVSTEGPALPETEEWTDPDGSRTIRVGDRVRRTNARGTYPVLRLRREPVSGWCVVVKDEHSGGIRTFPVTDVRVDKRRSVR